MSTDTLADQIAWLKDELGRRNLSDRAQRVFLAICDAAEQGAADTERLNYLALLAVDGEDIEGGISIGIEVDANGEIVTMTNGVGDLISQSNTLRAAIDAAKGKK